MNLDLSIYRDLFVNLIDTNDPTVIQNNSPAHARIIIQELVRHAQESVHILCTHFSRTVYDDPAIQNAITDAINRGVAVHIAVRDNFPQAAEFFVRLQACRPENCEYLAGIQANSNALGNDFCVVDSRRYRLERDQQKGTAFVCANDPTISDRLVRWFRVSTATKVA